MQSRSLLSPRWMGPFKVLASACPALRNYRWPSLDVPATWRVFPEFNVECPRLYRRGSEGRDPPAAGEVPRGACECRCCSSSEFATVIRPSWPVLMPRSSALGGPRRIWTMIW
jgi:hypothetical protein